MPIPRSHPGQTGERDDRVQRIRASIDSIPKGQVRSYGEVAAEAGLPGRARMVGRILREAGPKTDLPWYRVVAAGGRIATSGRTAGLQTRLLKAEGLRFKNGRVVQDP